MGEYLTKFNHQSWSADWFCCVLYTPFALWWKSKSISKRWAALNGSLRSETVKFVAPKVLLGRLHILLWSFVEKTKNHRWIPVAGLETFSLQRHVSCPPHLSNVHLCFWNLWIGVVEPTHLAGWISTAEARNGSAEWNNAAGWVQTGAGKAWMEGARTSFIHNFRRTSVSTCSHAKSAKLKSKLNQLCSEYQDCCESQLALVAKHVHQFQHISNMSTTSRVIQHNSEVLHSTLHTKNNLWAVMGCHSSSLVETTFEGKIRGQLNASKHDFPGNSWCILLNLWVLVLALLRSPKWLLDPFWGWGFRHGKEHVYYTNQPGQKRSTHGWLEIVSSRYPLVN